MLLPLVGGTLGAIEGYRQGGLGGAVLGAGAGAVTPAALRMAGAALGAKLGAGVLGKASGAVSQQALAANLAARELGKEGIKGAVGKAGLAGSRALGSLGANLGTAAGIGGLAAGAGTLLGVPGRAGELVGGAARGVGDLAGRAGQAGVGIIGRTSTGEPVYGQIGGGAVPPVGQYGGIDPYGDPTDIYGAAGMAQRAQTYKDAENLRDVMRLINPEILAAAEARSKKEFERNMAAAGIRQNIATRAAMIQQAQQAGLNAGLTAASQAGDALTRQYQYQ